MRADIDKNEMLKEIRKDVKEGLYKNALGKLSRLSEPGDDLSAQNRYAAIQKTIPPDVVGLKKIRLAILASSTVKHFRDVIAYWLALEGFAADIYVAEFNIQQEILDPQSGLYSFRPEIVMIFTNYRDIICGLPPGSGADDAAATVDNAVAEYTRLWEAMGRNGANCHIIQNNADLPYFRPSGNYEGMAAWGILSLLRDYNSALAKAAVSIATVFDIDFLSSVYGKKAWHDKRYWYHSKHSFAPDATGLVAYHAARVISAVKGGMKKCVIVDLDNTLWGGVVGDDGVDGIVLGHGADGEAYRDFQAYLLSLKERGIIIAVCSKNDEDIAKAPFLRHPDMRLKIDDIVVFKANWNDKAANIKEIAGELNIGLDSLVFIDDNPAERALVRETLPMVSVPELPEDPSDYVDCVSGRCYFETITFSTEDVNRISFYKDNITRAVSRKHFTDLTDYLKDLDMRMTVRGFIDMDIPRVAQLINKSNQFHLTTTRYTEAELRVIRNNPENRCLSFSLRDRFGDNGTVSAVILKIDGNKALYIDTWVMSCRVLSRTVEEFVMNEIIAVARDKGCSEIKGKYIPTDKNKLVSGLYERLGFSKTGDVRGSTSWALKIKSPGHAYDSFVARIDTENSQGG